MGSAENSSKGSKGSKGVERKSHTQIAIDEIKRLIIENELPAGSSHLESELAEKLGMSRTPVREAALILETLGLLWVRPRHGIQVRPITPGDMNEIYLIVSELEGLAAQLAAERKLDDADLATAQKAIDDMDLALEHDNREQWAAADEVFHRELLRLSGSERIAKLVETYNNQVKRIRNYTLHLRPSPVQSNEDHCKLLKAIRRSDAAAARAIHTEHRNRARILLVALLEKYKFN